MKQKELNQMSKEDLENKLVELRKELIKVNAQIATGTSIKNPGQLKKTKKTVAQILNTLKSKEGDKKI